MNWTLHAMRDHNVADPIGGLGPRVERAPTPAPAPVVRPDGIVVHPDGTLSTELPLPEGHPDATPTHIGGVPVWPLPSKPAGDVPDGAMWRGKGNGLFYRWRDGLAEAHHGTHFDTWDPSNAGWLREEFDNAEAFERIAEEPEPGACLREPLKDAS